MLLQPGLTLSALVDNAQACTVNSSILLRTSYRRNPFVVSALLNDVALSRSRTKWDMKFIVVANDTGLRKFLKQDLSGLVEIGDLVVVKAAQLNGLHTPSRFNKVTSHSLACTQGARHRLTQIHSLD